MAEKSSSVTEGIPKWQIAAAVGTPIVVGLAGYWYFRRRKARRPRQGSDKGSGADATPKEQEGWIAPGTPAVGPAQAAVTGDCNSGPLQAAQAAKAKGNKYFKGGKYDSAITCYTEAIALCPPANSAEIATFYQNRAAAYEQLKSYENVIEDCTKALELNSKYVKAMFRRAKACEVTGKLGLCLEDVTAVCILENFQNQHSVLVADRVLKELGKQRAQEAYKDRQPVAPSSQFIRTYFSAFANDPILENLKEKLAAVESAYKPAAPEPKEAEASQAEEEVKESGDDAGASSAEELDQEEQACTEKYLILLRSLAQENYTGVIEKCRAVIDAGSKCRYVPEALLLHATFLLLHGEGEKAATELTELLARTDLTPRIRSNALIKKGSLHMQNGLQAEALEEFAAAVKVDPKNSDIYHHRGQLHLLIDKVEAAVSDFEHSVSLRPEFAIAYVQKCYTEYRLAFTNRSPLQMQNALKSFEETIAKFPDCSEGYALYGQALNDQQMYEKANETFQKAISLEPDNGNIYVHKGLLQLQWKQDIEEAARLMNKALEVDRGCEFAYETLGTIEIQRGNIDTAISLFDQAIKLAKTQVEMAHLFSLKEAALTQNKVARRLGMAAPLGASMMG
ncbi:hypothetical protein CAPTEDRAFT_174469 [Capitella teleta]|uniref:Mitochondrial import receptor subunit TOM70 n=1 Tax=Capitella teleta TaxID=283909 RepID=R7TTJ9_CAPTE|nr:hypothetical protein CAPTEDRAFT_174469 [Capitella teleta]|eukprot:ELT97004.1 hypothetical protein CAPTEDRAFT_174469 [Capitella teleta]